MNYKKITLNLFLSLFSIYIPLFLFCGYEILFRSAKSAKTLINKRRKEEISLKIDALQKGFLPTYSPSYLLRQRNTPKYYPIGSLPFTNSYLCYEGYNLTKFKTDRFGLRNSDDKWNSIKKKSHLFLIGDSMVVGSCVDDPFTISSIIEKNLNKKTFNLGMGGNTPYEYLAILKTFVRPILEFSNKENHVILFFYPNDDKPVIQKREKLLEFSESIIEISSKGELLLDPYYKENHYEFIENNLPISQTVLINSMNKNNYKYSTFYQIISLVPIRHKIKKTIKKQNNYKILMESEDKPSLKAISLLADVCKLKCNPIVVFIPNSKFWDNSYLNENYKKQLREKSNQLNISFLDGEDVINKNNRKNYAPKGGHLSIEGYEKLANYISEYLKNI